MATNEVEYWLQECLDNDDLLNDWERKFLDSRELVMIKKLVSISRTIV